MLLSISEKIEELVFRLFVSYTLFSPHPPPPFFFWGGGVNFNKSMQHFREHLDPSLSVEYRYIWKKYISFSTVECGGPISSAMYGYTFTEYFFDITALHNL